MPWAPSGFLQLQAWMGLGLLCLEPGAWEEEAPKSIRQVTVFPCLGRLPAAFPQRQPGARGWKVPPFPERGLRPGSPTQIFRSWPFYLGAPVCPGAARTGTPSSSSTEEGSSTGGPGPHTGRIFLGVGGEGCLQNTREREVSGNLGDCSNRERSMNIS